MKEKITRRILTIGLWTLLGCIVTFIMHISQDIYYKHAPISHFIDFQRLDLGDYNVGDEIQMVYAYRDSRIETIGDFTFRLICNGEGNTKWNSHTKSVLLHRTIGLEKIVIQSTPNDTIPEGICEVFTHIDLEIHGIWREINLTDKFVVGKTLKE